MRSSRAFRSTEKRTLAPVRPNAGTEAAYRRKLDALIEAMHRSLARWLLASYRADGPILAADAEPERDLIAEMAELGDRWQSRFDEVAPILGAWFAKSTSMQADAAMAKTLRDAGISVRFQASPAVQQVLDATMQAQVGLIKSIGAQHLAQVQQCVMRSVQTGRDVGGLAKEIGDRFKVTRRRAAIIARSQSNIATATITRTRQVELGITVCVWMHSAGGREPRATHVAAGRDKATYDPREGWLDPAEGRRIFPGELPNCRCVSRAVIKGIGLTQ